MKYKTINMNSYNIHFIKTDKFKTIDVRVVFCDELKDRSDISKRNFLFDILTYSSKKYPTKRMLNIKCQELYSLYLNSSSFRLGNYLISRVGISFLNPKYTEAGMIEESVDLLKEILMNPNITDNKFDAKSFSNIKTDLKAEIDTIKEQPRLYANIKMLENMGKGYPYGYHGYCYHEDLETITEENLYAYYKQLLNSNLVDIFVVGDFEFKKMENIIKEKFKITTLKKPKKEMFIKHSKYRINAKKIIENGDYKQSKLSIGMKLKELSEFEEKYVSNVYNLLLGGISDSVLMKNVREKSSLAYYVSSSLNKADNLIIVNSGIEGNNFNKTMRVIKKSMQEITQGEFTDDDIKKCQTEYIAALDSAILTPNGVMDLMLSSYLFKTDDIKTKKKEILKVTKKDIIDFSKKISLDTIYLLKGE